MSLMIERFAASGLNKETEIQLLNKATVIITDREQGAVVSFVKVSNKKEENKEVAKKIVEVLEEYVGE